LACHSIGFYFRVPKCLPSVPSVAQPCFPAEIQSLESPGIQSLSDIAIFPRGSMKPHCMSFLPHSPHFSLIQTDPPNEFSGNRLSVFVGPLVPAADFSRHFRLTRLILERFALLAVRGLSLLGFVTAGPFRVASAWFFIVPLASLPRAFSFQPFPFSVLTPNTDSASPPSSLSPPPKTFFSTLLDLPHLFFCALR